MPNSRERVLTFAFAVLFFLHVGYTLLGFASVPAYYERVTTGTIETYSIGGQDYVSNAMAQSEAAKRGMSLATYAIEQIVFAGAVVLLCGILAALIVWRARSSWFAWFSAFFLVFISEYALSAPLFIARLLPISLLEVASLGWPLILLYLFFFPNGKAVPRPALWLLMPLALIHLFIQSITIYATIDPTSPLILVVQKQLDTANAMIAVEIVLILVCQIYRYLRVSSPLEKQQTKWFLGGLVLFVGTAPLDDVIASSPYATEINLLLFAFVPVSVGIAILRYRLWDIDVVVRRTLTYALVTALLVVVFFGSVILLQQIFSTFTSSGQNEIVTVLSTLVIAALFIPLRNRIQTEIDKRFNRKKYNAQQVLNDFATTVRDETDLEKLTARLMQVVDETMQPKSVSVWLKKETGRQVIK